MFVVRVVVVGLGFFGVLYCLLSLLIVCAWRSIRLLRIRRPSTLANSLYALRVLPLVVSFSVTVAFAVPAFLLMESGSIDEDMGTLVFGVGALLIVAAGLFRALSTYAQTSRVVGEWLEGAQRLDAGSDLPIVRARPGTPPLLLIGISTPQVLVSESAISLLSGDELRVAVRHETEHIRSRDNLRKLILHCAPFPGTSGLENAWYEATELAADHAAVATRKEAIDLAVALLKLSELAPLQALPAMTTGLMTNSMLVKLRVERLLSWNEGNTGSVEFALVFLWGSVLTVGLYAIANYGYALLLTHQATEWFVH